MMKMVKYASLVALVLMTGLFVACASKPAVQQLAPKVIKAKAKAVVLEYTETRTDNFVMPVVQTGPTGLNIGAGDADDPAIWVHPTDPTKSLIFGVDKVDGLYVWNMDGEEILRVDAGGKPGNVDIRTDFELGGKRVDIVALNLRKIEFVTASKLAVYAINPDYTSGDDLLMTLADGKTENNDITVGTYGFGLYQNPETKLVYAFENASVGNIQQYLIEDDGTGEAIKLTLVRELVFEGNVCEGMVADDELGFIYVAEEDRAVLKYYADPDASPEAFKEFALAEDGYSRDREGITLLNFADGTGYFIVCDQGDASNQIASILQIYERQGDNKFVKTVAHLDRNGLPMWDDDGVDAFGGAILPMFPNGLVVGHDGADSSFTLYDWRDIAGTDLKISGE